MDNRARSTAVLINKGVQLNPNRITAEGTTLLSVTLFLVLAVLVNVYTTNWNYHSLHALILTTLFLEGT